MRIKDINCAIGKRKKKKDDSSEEEEEIKGRKHVTFEDEDPPPKLKIDYGEPVAEIRDIMLIYLCPKDKKEKNKKISGIHS